MSSPSRGPVKFEQRDRPLYDYGKLYSGAPRYSVGHPESIADVVEMLRASAQESRPVRVRASGHTFSGASLPRDGERLLRMDGIDHFRFEEEGTVTVGGGAIVWDVRDLVRDHGFDLPVYNGGWAGPTVGGYINAGGLGKSGLSEVHGGLWENIDRLTLVDGLGRLRTFSRSDFEFPWVFGSYGQLGVVVEAKLRLTKLDGRSQDPRYPLGLCGRVERRQEDDPAVNDDPPDPAKLARYFWFSLMIDPEAQARAWVGLYKWVRKHKDVIHPEAGWAGLPWKGAPLGYLWEIRFREFNPPLLYPEQSTFMLVGVMTQLDSGAPETNTRVLEIEGDFIDMAMQGGHRLYVQAENMGRRIDLPQYYGEDIFSAFRKLKDALDPKGILNPGVVFPEGA